MGRSSSLLPRASVKFTSTGPVCFANLTQLSPRSCAAQLEGPRSRSPRNAQRTPTYASRCGLPRAWQFESRAQPGVKAELNWLATWPSAKLGHDSLRVDLVAPRI